jgi:hypothetical protein
VIRAAVHSAAPGDDSVPPIPTPRAKTDEATQPLVAEILLQLAQVTERLEPNDLETKRWRANNARNPAVADMLRDLTQASFLDV